MLHLRLTILGLVAVLLAGCPSTQTVPDSEAASQTTYEDQSGADTGAYSESGMGEGEFIDDPFAAGELANVIYFDFDSSELRADDTDIVTRHAIQLRDNPGWSVRLEGHADERGSREYNIGLGERRAQTVRRMLLIQGAAASQIVTVSFGEERPAAFGSDEDAYAQNRRVEFKYTN
jgi:peptidoglycan-associated lipoprotein